MKFFCVKCELVVKSNLPQEKHYQRNLVWTKWQRHCNTTLKPEMTQICKNIQFVWEKTKSHKTVATTSFNFMKRFSFGFAVTSPTNCFAIILYANVLSSFATTLNQFVNFFRLINGNVYSNTCVSDVFVLLLKKRGICMCSSRFVS